MRRASGCLFGVAFGDALGAVTEFLRVEEILRVFPPNGPQEIVGDPARVTDDTQMTLSVGEALVEALPDLTPQGVEAPLRRNFIDWWRSPENNRSPGATCLHACAGLLGGRPWQQATIPTSKGCGANMRVAPVGLLAVNETKRSAIAQFQAALTHGHPTGLAASDLTAVTIAFLMAGAEPQKLPGYLREYANKQRQVYHIDWLGPLWERPGINSPEEFISRGWDECLQVLDRLDAALVNPDREADPCEATGEGWIAEEAFGTGLLCFLLYPDQPITALRRAVLTSGDSDSIACLTGAFAGAYLGMAVWPDDWVRRIEYRDRLEALGQVWD